jgi:release factor glutamine methyltransferase
MIAGLAATESIATARLLIARAFRQQKLDSPDLDARVLVGHALGLDHSKLAAAADRLLTDEEAARISALAERRLAREPVARIIGEKEFWGLALQLDAATLVPRPETETIVEAALAAISEADRREQPLLIADLGTGSGALLLALLSELPRAYGVGTDISTAALATARRNAARHGLAGRTAFVACDFGAALRGEFDLVVSNPPYIRSEEIANLGPEVSRFDPRLALDGGADGLDCYRSIGHDATRLLKRHGQLVVELGVGACDGVTKVFADAGLACALPRCDLSGIPRALAARPAA